MKNRYGRIIASLLCIVSCLCVTVFVLISSRGGNVKNVRIIDSIKSDMYSRQDVDDAIEVVLNIFSRQMSGCTLKEIYYAGDESSDAYKGLAKRNNADEAIVLLSTFETGELEVAAGLNTGDIYPHYMWILVRDIGGKWRCVDRGY